MTRTPSPAHVQPVQLTIEDLPSDVARQIQHYQSEDPQFVRRLLLYGVTHRVVFETLSNAWSI